MAMHVFDLKGKGRYFRARMLGEWDCTQLMANSQGFRDLRDLNKGPMVAPNMTLARARFQACTDNFAFYSKLLFGARPVFLRDLRNATCFRNLVAGHSMALSLSGGVMSTRGYFLRRFRDYALRRLKLKPPPTLPSHHILILAKAGGEHIKTRKEVWPRICETVKEQMRTAGVRGINSTCLHPHNTSLRAQIAELQRASVIVSEDGSISYGSFFARNGVRHIMLGNDGVDSNVNSKRSATPEFMEGFALLFHGYMQMIYVMHKDFNRLFGEVLRTALDHAAVDLNLPPVGRGRGHDKVQAWV